MPLINVAPFDAALSINVALPASGANITTGIIDMGAIAPNSNAWRLGRFAVLFPAMPENNVVANTITVTMKAAPPSLTGGASAVAPNTPLPGAFVTTTQVITVAGVVAGGSIAQYGYFTLAFDPTGSPYQFYEFTIVVGAINTVGETVTIGWING